MLNSLKNSKYYDLFTFLCFLTWLFLGATIFAFPMFILGPIASGLSFEEYISNTQLVTEHTYIPAVVSHLLGIIVFIILYKNIISSDSKSFKSNWWKYLLIIIAGFVLLYLSNYLMGIIYDALGFSDQTSANQQGIIDALNGSTKIFVIIYTVILAPIFEEVVFRRLFYTALKKYTKLPVWAIVLMIATVFAFIHVTDVASFVFFPQYFVLALIITIAYAITKENLLVSIGLHFLNNLVAVLEILL